MTLFLGKLGAAGPDCALRPAIHLLRLGASPNAVAFFLLLLIMGTGGNLPMDMEIWLMNAS
jgi:hypothetical protein